ncbi:MAG: HAD hydrolase family protein [Halobacteria archaeon]
MGYRLVCVDYDRTVTDEALRPHLEAIAALRDARRRGIRTALVTGRFFSFAEKFSSRHPEAVDAYVMENGCIGVAEGRKELLCDPDGRAEVLARVRALPVAWAAGEVVISVEAAARERLLPHLPEGFEAIPNVDALMVVPKGVSKAGGVAWLQRRLGISRPETAGIGDGENDLCFREACGFVGAPANSTPEMKALADVVSAKGYGAGTAEILRSLR